MKRPAISIEQHNLIYNVGIGISWLVSAFLRLIADSIAIKVLIVIVGLILVSLVLYSIIGKRERDDELTFTYAEQARSFGFFVGTCICLIFFSISLIDENFVSLVFAAPVILGVSHIAVGWRFYHLEKYGDE